MTFFSLLVMQQIIDQFQLVIQHMLPSPGGTLTVAFTDSDPGSNGGLPLNVTIGTDKNGDPIYDNVDRFFTDGFWTVTNTG